MNFIEKSIELTLKANEGKLDKNGYPSVLTSLKIGLMGTTDEEKSVGFLCDILGEKGVTQETLLHEEIPSGVVNAVTILTQAPAENMPEYCKRVVATGNPVALRVLENKLAVIQDNDNKFSALVKDAIQKQSKVKLYDAGAVKGKIDYAVFACGCFWGTQHQFNREQGVLRTVVGYTGGSEHYPSYEQVRNHLTSHVEAVLVEYDKAKTDYTKLCKVFFEIHDPAQTDGVGPDLGPQYRSCLFYKDENEKQQALAVANLLRAKGYEVNTLFLPLGDFWIGEELHQDYYDKTGGEPYCHLRRKKI